MNATNDKYEAMRFERIGLRKALDRALTLTPAELNLKAKKRRRRKGRAAKQARKDQR